VIDGVTTQDAIISCKFFKTEIDFTFLVMIWAEWF